MSRSFLEPTCRVESSSGSWEESACPVLPSVPCWVSRGWIQSAIVVFLFDFLVPGLLANRTYTGEPPIPGELGGSGGPLFNRDGKAIEINFAILNGLRVESCGPNSLRSRTLKRTDPMRSHRRTETQFSSPRQESSYRRRRPAAAGDRAGAKRSDDQL